MAKLQLGVGAKVWVLVSRLHPKDVISKAYPNYTKADKAEGLVVASEGPKPIHREEKVVVVFHHPPKHQQTQEFDCWVLHCFIHVTEEGDESGLFSLTNSMSENNSEEAQGTQQDPNNTVITENSQENEENVHAEIVQLMKSETAIISSDDTDLIRNICPDMVDNDNQPLPENVPTEGETTTTANQPQIFSSWEHSGSCFCYLLCLCIHFEKNLNIGQNTSREQKQRPILMVRMLEIVTHGRE